MKRRAFIAGLGSAAAWPVLARGQQGGKVRRIGLLSGASREGASNNVDAFLQGMRALGYVEGRDFITDFRFADGNYERFPELAAELVRLEADVIVTVPGLQFARCNVRRPQSRLCSPIRPILWVTVSSPALRVQAGTSLGFPAHPKIHLQNSLNW